jgi:hypothetical protein
MQGAFCPPATPNHPTIAASGVISTGGMDNNGVYQRNSVASWSSMQAAPPPPLRTFTKVEIFFNAFFVHKNFNGAHLILRLKKHVA